MKRVVAIDVLRRGDCGARRQVIASITNPDPIYRILTHRALARRHRAAQPPPIAPTRPLSELAVPF